jgi:hypothetical protein
MPLYRSTVWTDLFLTGDIKRFIAEKEAPNREFFKAEVISEYVGEDETNITFGPISQINVEKRKVKGRKYGFSS